MSEKELTELIEKIKLRRLELGLSYQELSDLTSTNLLFKDTKPDSSKKFL